MPEAQKLRRLFEYVADRLGLSLAVVVTDGRQPIGRGVGPVLEARDVMAALRKGRTQLVFEPVDGQLRMLIAVPVFYPPAASHEGVLLSKVGAAKFFAPATNFLRPS